MILVQELAPIARDDRDKDLFELPDNHLHAQLANDEDDDIIEDADFQPINKSRKQRTTRSEKRTDDDANYHYVLPKVRYFLLCKSILKFYIILQFSDVDESAMKNLPAEMQHEILVMSLTNIY